MISRAYILFAAIAAVGLGAALYGINSPNGNGGAGDQLCDSVPGSNESLTEHVRGEIAAFQVAGKAMNLSGLNFQDENSQSISIGEFPESIILLNLWATWCAPCRREMPALDRLQTEIGGAKFTVVTVNIDTGSFDKPEKFLQSVGVKNLPKYRDPSTNLFQEMRRMGLALGLPATALIDREGCLIGHLQGPAEWDSEDAKNLIRAVL